MRSIGYPIYGDPKYNKYNPGIYPYLHAAHLSFEDPKGRIVEIVSLPKWIPREHRDSLTDKIRNSKLVKQ